MRTARYTVQRADGKSRMSMGVRPIFGMCMAVAVHVKVDVRPAVVRMFMNVHMPGKCFAKSPQADRYQGHAD